MEIQIVQRGCGWPSSGGLYARIPLGKNGIRPEGFLIDYTEPIPKGLEIKKRGLTLVDIDGTTHIMDWIGAPYLSFPDWWEELCRFGFHQRVEKNLNFSKLDPQKSRFLMVHPRGFVRNAKQYEKLQAQRQFHSLVRYCGCPKNIKEHNQDAKGTCIAILWQTLLKGKPYQEDNLRERTMPAFTYYGFELPVKAAFEPAFVASFPISMMQWLVYKGQGGEEQETVQALKNAPDFLKQNLQLVETEK